MKPWEAIEQHLESFSGVTNIVGNRITHGMQPNTRQRIPCVNYFMIAYSQGTKGVTETPAYQISCWAGSADEAMELAREVMIAFQNTRCAIGVFNLQSSWIEDLQIIAEPDTGVYHVPVTVRLFYESADNV
jgi:hypothetical protein